ncbi:hypothetical protein V6932_003852 [Vibrio alginolyticus]
MLFEKQLAPRKERLLDWIMYLSIVSLIFLYFIYAYFALHELVGETEPVKLTDVISSVGQVATALTFFLAFWQYRKNSKDKRQSELASEAKAQITKMIEVLDGVGIKENTEFTNLNKSMILLANLGSNFDKLFFEMDEDIQKAMVRMHWQNMYFNHMAHVFTEIDIVPILEAEASLKSVDFTYEIVQAKEVAKREMVEAYQDYVFVRELLDSQTIRNKYSLKNKFSSLDKFTHHYMNHHHLKDHMFGLLSVIDIKARAPILAVAEPSEWALCKDLKKYLQNRH